MVTTEEFKQQLDAMTYIVENNPALLKMIQEYKVAFDETIVIQHSLAKYLQCAGFKQVSWNNMHDLIDYFYRIGLPGTGLNDKPQAKIAEVLSMGKGEEVVLEILNTDKQVKNASEMYDKIKAKGYEINKNSLKWLLSKMKKDGRIINRKPKGMWVLINPYQDGTEK